MTIPVKALAEHLFCSGFTTVSAVEDSGDEGSAKTMN